MRVNIETQLEICRTRAEGIQLLLDELKENNLTKLPTPAQMKGYRDEMSILLLTIDTVESKLRELDAYEWGI